GQLQRKVPSRPHKERDQRLNPSLHRRQLVIVEVNGFNHFLSNLRSGRIARIEPSAERGHAQKVLNGFHEPAASPRENELVHVPDLSPGETALLLSRRQLAELSRHET